MKTGIELTRRVFSLDEVAEHRLNNWRLREMQNREIDPEILEDRAKLERAEDNLIKAVRRYMRLGTSKAMARRIVDLAIDSMDG
jgi:hypothetical protein